MKSLGCTQMRGWKPQGGWSWVSLHAGAEPRPQDESAGCPWTRGAAVGGGGIRDRTHGDGSGWDAWVRGVRSSLWDCAPRRRARGPATHLDTPWRSRSSSPR